MTNYVWERRKQDKIDYKRYEKMLMAFVLITALAGIGVGILGMLLAVLG
jgi:hypothetical protein